MMYNDECDCLMWDRCTHPSRPSGHCTSSEQLHNGGTMDTKQPKTETTTTTTTKQSDASKAPTEKSETADRQGTSVPKTEDIGAHKGSTNAATTPDRK